MKNSSSTTTYHEDVASYYDEDVRMGFEERAGQNIILDRIRNDFREITGKYPFTSALEIGCGPGFDIEWFARKHKDRDFTAVDISPEMISLASGRLKGLENARAIVADERQLFEKFGKASFDLVYVYFGALNTVDNLDFAASQLTKILCPGAYVVVTFVNKWYLREMFVQMLKLKFRAAFSRLKPIWGGYSPQRFLPSRCYSPKQVIKAFKGMKLIERKGYSIFYPAWYNQHKITRDTEKADKLWALDQKLQSGSFWSKGEYTLFVFQLA